jgi:hypothetical protein
MSRKALDDGRRQIPITSGNRAIWEIWRRQVYSRFCVLDSARPHTALSIQHAKGSSYV